MTKRTEFFIETSDAQGYTETVSLEITPVTDFGAAVDLPTITLMTDLVRAIFNDTTPYVSTSIVTNFGIRIFQDDMSVVSPGSGAVGTNIAGKMRSDIGISGPIGRNGVAEGIELRIPGLDKSQMVLNPQDLNSITTSSANWVAIRAALVALGYRPKGGLAISSGNTLQVGVIFTGTRAPMKPR
jgi:hypothetical protein